MGNFCSFYFCFNSNLKNNQEELKEKIENIEQPISEMAKSDIITEQCEENKTDKYDKTEHITPKENQSGENKYHNQNDKASGDIEITPKKINCEAKIINKGIKEKNEKTKDKIINNSMHNKEENSRNQNEISLQTKEEENIKNNKSNEPNNKLSTKRDNYFTGHKEIIYIFPKIGLQNVGSTCFMNAILQCIIHNKVLFEYFLNEYPDKKDHLKKINYENSETKGEIASELYSLFKEINVLKLTNNSVRPYNFKMKIGQLDKRFLKFEAADSRDLLLLILPNLESELNEIENNTFYIPSGEEAIYNKKYAIIDYLSYYSKNKKSVISNEFEMLSCLQNTCDNCKKTNSEDDGAFSFKIDLMTIINLKSFVESNISFSIDLALDENFKDIRNSGMCQTYCQKCNKEVDGWLFQRIIFPPKNLIINLNRGINKMYDIKTEFDMDVNIEKYIDDFTKKFVCSEYKLKSVVTHLGSSGEGGHYIAYIRDEEIWYCFNDSRCEECEQKDIFIGSPVLLIYEQKGKNRNINDIIVELEEEN